MLRFGVSSFSPAFFSDSQISCGLNLSDSEKPPRDYGGVLWDIVCLVGFALVAVWICDSSETPQFLCRNLIFGAIAVGISIVNIIRRWPALDFAAPWLVINFLQVAVVAAVLLFGYSEGQAVLSWGYPLAYLIAMYSLFLLADVGFQIQGLTKP